MAKLPSHVEIIFLIITGCIGHRCMGITWKETLDKRLLDIFYGTYPDDEHHMERVKQEWDRQVPGHDGVGVDELAKHLSLLQNRYWDQWKKHPPNEREWVEKILIRIFDAVKKDPQDQEERMLEMFLRDCPQYTGMARLMRTIVYRWHKLFTPLGKEIPAKYVDWTPEREAYLQDVFNQITDNKRNKTNEVEQLWMAKYGYLNVDKRSLMRHAYYVKNKNIRESEKEESHQATQGNSSQLASNENTTQKKVFVLKGRRSKWSPQMKADVLCIMNKLHGLNVSQAAAVKDRWDRMQKNYTYLKGESLLVHAHQLKSRRYVPDLENTLKAEQKYAELPPLPKEVFSKRKGKKKSQPLRIPEGHQPRQQYQEEPSSPSVEFTPELLAHLHQDMAAINSPYAEHAYYPQQTADHGSCRHNPIDQSQFTPLLDTQNPHQQSWNAAGSSSHTPIQTDPFGSLLHTPYAHQGLWSQGDSSSHTPLHHDQFGSLPDISNPLAHFSSLGGSSSHTSIHEDSSGLIVVTPRPQHHQLDHRRSSNHTSVHPGPSHSQPDTPRPYHHQWFPGSGSRP